MQGLQIKDLIDFTPELRAQAEQLVKRYKIGPIFTPPVVSKIDGPLSTLALATAGGGTNWAGGAFDPETHIAYIPSQKSLSQLGLVATDPAKTDFAFVQGNAREGARTSGGAGADAGAETRAPAPAAAAGEGGGGGLTIQGLPLMKPPYGQITAINLDKGDILWQIAHGETPDNVKNNPALRGRDIPRTGRPGVIGALVTKTLVIAGESGFVTTPQGRGAYLRAYDKATGKDAGTVFMNAGQTGTPMTYQVNGRQYIVVGIGGQGFPAEYVAYRLPNN